MNRWIIQRKVFKGDWETITAILGGTKAEAERRFDYLNGKVRAVSEAQAEKDREAGRADNWTRKLADQLA
jgi:hypothetical protein